MTSKRRHHSAEFKFRVALEAAKNEQTLRDLSQEYNVHPNQISAWKGQLLREGTRVFQRGVSKEQQAQEKRETALYEQIGRLKMELEWLKKKATRFD
jgi:transposase-like protein